MQKIAPLQSKLPHSSIQPRAGRYQANAFRSSSEKANRQIRQFRLPQLPNSVGNKVASTRLDVAVRASQPNWDSVNQFFQSLAANFSQQAQPTQNAASLTVDRLVYQPPGAEVSLLSDISLHLPSAQLGLVYGQSGAGKSTLLQLISGLATASSGWIQVSKTPEPSQTQGQTSKQLAEAVGLVFQFPERHFLGATLVEELTFGWSSDPWQQHAAELQLQEVLKAVDLSHIPLSTKLTDLSDGYKRRVALAVQLARSPSLLLLDEPLAGLDWRARADVAKVLGQIKKQCTILAVSHDLRELVPLVDKAWQMAPGGILKSSEWPPVTQGQPSLEATSV